MVNPSKKKGSAYEGHVCETYLVPIWPGAERISNVRGSKDYGDFINTGRWLIEAKKRARLVGEIMGWVRVVMSKVRWRAHRQARLHAPLVERVSVRVRDEWAAEHLPWAIVMAGDKRQEPEIDLMLLPASWGFKAIAALEQAGGGR